MTATTKHLSRDHAEMVAARFLGRATTMTVPMVGWMLPRPAEYAHHGHDHRTAAEPAVTERGTA